MRSFNLVKSLTNLVTNRKGLLILCLSLAVFGVESVWGASATWTVKVGVKDGKGGTAKAEIWEDASSDKKTTETSETSSSLVSTSCSDKTSIVHWSLNSYYGKFIATASAGYSFLDWYDANGNAQNKSATFSTNSSNNNSEWTYYAKFTPNTNTAYIVKHYKENVAGTGYDLADTDNLTGTTDTKVTPNRKSYTGFTAPAGQEITIKGDGSASVSYNYTRNSYTLTWNLDGGTITTAGTSAGFVKYGATLTAPAVSKAGAQFNGWSPEVSATMPADNVTYTAQWVSKYDFEMSGENRSMKVDEELPNAFTFTHADNPVAHISNTNVVTYDATNNKLIAHQEGTATIYFTQAATTTIQAGTSDTYTITVSKITNTLTADASHSMKVDETWSGVISGKNSDATVTTTTSDGTIAYYDVANNKIIAQNTGNQSFNSKEVTITISQEATYKYTAAEETIKVTVSKWDNHISINGNQDSYAANAFMDGYAQINLTATNTDYAGSPITANQTAGNNIATFYPNDKVVYSTYNLGDATWTVSQPENYKYKAANATFTIHVVKQAEATNCYVLNEPSTKDIGWYSNSDGIEYSLSGPGEKMTLNVWRTSAATNEITVYGYTANNIESTLATYDASGMPTSPTPKTINNISSDIVKIKIKAGGTLDKHFSNVLITRKTYLTAGNVEITETYSENPIHPNEVGVGTLTINHSLANGGNLKVKWDNDKFKIDGKTAAQGIDLGDLGCSTDISNLPISYTSSKVGTDTANVVIYNNVYRATATISGTTIKRDQNLQWNTDIMLVGQTEPEAAQTTSIINGIVTYTSDNTEVIRVNTDDKGQLTILEALQPGTANITAFSAGNEEYNDAESTKKIIVTDKQIQYITWNQSLMGLKMGDADVPLNASAYQPDSLNCATGGQRPITYSSANTAVVEIVDGNKLRIKGIGVTTVTASQAGGKDNDGHDFIAVTTEKKVVVRDPNAPCEAYIYEQMSEVEFDLGWNAASHQTKTYEIDFNGQEPGFVNFDYKGKARKVLFDYYEGTLSIEQYVSGQWVPVRNFGKPETSGYTNTGDIALDRKATKMRVKAADGMGYMYFKDCRITLARYLEGSTLSTFETKVGAPLTKTLTIKYSNISGPVIFSLSENSNFSINKESIEGECGGYGTTSLDITYTPTTQTIGEEATLTLADDIQKMYIVLKGNASVTPLHINWDIPDNNTCYTIQSVNLSAKALTDLDVEIPNFVWFSLAQNSTTGILTGNTLTFDKAGNANVIAQTTGDPRYTPAINVFKNWTVNLTPTEVVTKPEIDGDIIYGAQLDDLKLKANTGSARNTVNQQTVEGTFSITGGDLSAAGEKTITVTFTPANTDMYASCTSTVSVTVQKAQPNAIAQAGEIIYGAAVGTSILTNEGTTEGIWTWTDEKKDQVLEVGTHEGLKVHFTPTNKTNYNEIDGTVSLTITGVMENVFNGEGDWNDPNNWTNGVPTSENPNIVVSGSLTISKPTSVGGLTIEANGKVTVVGEGDLTVNGTSGDRETYGNLFVRNGGDVTISENANVKVFDFVVESSIGTEGQSVSGQVKHSNRVLYTNGAYIDINMDPSGKMDDTQWYGFTVPFPVDVQSGIARKEGDVFRKCTYGVEYMICEYDINQRLNTGKGWKYIKSGKLQPGRFYYFTVNGDYNVYSFKAAENTITINNTTELRVNGEGPNANWNAVGNTTLTYATISGENVPAYVQTYVNGESRYMTVATSEAQFVVGCPFFFQASETATMILNEANKTVDAHYAPRQESVDKSVCVRIAEEGKHFSDQIYLTASQEATGEYTLGRDLAKAGIGTKSAQLWMNAYGQKLSVQDATLMGEQAYYELSIYAPTTGSYELSLPKVPANAVIYLTQNGYPIWNLNETPYVIECYKGTTNEYGLLLRLQEGGSPTDMQTMRSSEKVQKIMKDQRIYINANTQLYDLMGQKVK